MTGTSLRGRTALVTGAGSGVGRGIALALAAVGANVALAVRRQHTGDETAAMITAENGRSLSIECDVSNVEHVGRAVERTVSTFGSLDIVVHNAVAAHSNDPLALEAISPTQWDALNSVTWDGAFFLAQSAFDYLKRSGHGRFLLLGSCYGLHGAALNPIYASLKGGNRGLAKALAREWAPFGIAVHSIQPAALTELAEKFFAEHPVDRASFIANFPGGRIGDPRIDIGRAVASLCGDEFDYVTAQSIQVDGGLYTAV
jgi:3-oxoacyl-[acyl-carrier protein] reductase